MRTLMLIAGLTVLALTAQSRIKDTLIRASQPDGNHMVISCANGADPAIKGADQYNTIIVSCVDERK